MRRLMIAAALAVAAATSACNLAPPASPSTVAETTKLDQQIAITAELAYKAARIAVETATDAGLIKGETATKAALADTRAQAAVNAVRSAYRAGNASSYADAAIEAQSAVNGMLAAIKGE